MVGDGQEPGAGGISEVDPNTFLALLVNTCMTLNKFLNLQISIALAKQDGSVESSHKAPRTCLALSKC